MSFKAFVWAWDQDVPNGDFQHVLLCLANIAPSRETYASVPYIARQVRRSPRKVRAALLWLEEAAIIVLTPRAGRTDLIRLNIPAEFRVLMPDEDDDLEAGVRGRPRKTPALGLPKPLQNPSTQGADEPEEPERTSLSSRAPDDFDTWWAIYPRKVAKVAARKVWKATQAKIGIEDLAELTRRFADHMVGTDPQYIAHPAKWLKDERWTDELPDRSQTDGQPARPARGTDHAADRADARVQAMVDGARQALTGGRRRWTLG